MSESMLDARPEEAARRLSIGFIDEARDASARLLAGSDDEALHDVRVALRRLRSTLRAYRDVLGDAIPRKRKRALSDLARATGDARDAEVQLAWAEGLSVRSGDVESAAGKARLAAFLRAKKEAGYASLVAETMPSLARLLPRLRSDLSHYTLEHVVFEEPAEHAFRALLGGLLKDEVAELDRCLREAASTGAEALAHQGRIHGKRIRYLLEPFKDDLPGGARATKSLRVLQEILGELNDLSVRTDSVRTALEATAQERARELADEAVRSEAAHRRSSTGSMSAPESRSDSRYDDAQEGLLLLLRHVLSDKQSAFERLAHEWLHGARLAELVSELDGLATALTSPRVPVEIERKYLLSALPPHVKTVAPQRIDQGYLPGEELIERIRRIKTAEGERYVRTVKLGRGVSRIEVEEACTSDVFKKLWSLTVGRRVQKRRYAIAAGDRVWEIDEFTDRPLVLAEIELGSADEVPEVPEWLAPYVVRDVTDESTYVNAKLAR